MVDPVRTTKDGSDQQSHLLSNHRPFVVRCVAEYLHGQATGAKVGLGGSKVTGQCKGLRSERQSWHHLDINPHSKEMLVGFRNGPT
jgi:hypothetical protein